MYSATWQWHSLNNLKLLSQTELFRLFTLPKFVIKLPNSLDYDKMATSISGEGFTVERVKSKCRADFALFICSLSIPQNDQDKSWYFNHGGGSALSLGPVCSNTPESMASQVAFWLPLEFWCRFPERYPAFKKQFSITIIKDNDNVDDKIKRIWVKKFLHACKNYKHDEPKKTAAVASKKVKR